MQDMAAPFTGKVAFVTGGSRGIGAAVSQRLASLGAHVALTFNSRAGAARSVVSAIELAGGQAAAHELDLSRPEAIDALVETIAADHGRIDILVHCAAIASNRALANLDATYVREMFDVNVLGTILLTRAVAPHLTAPGGRIVYFSSRLAVSPAATTSVYAASKAAVSALAQAFSKELGPRGITVNAVAPGVVDTEMAREAITERGGAIRAGTPLGRIGTPEDIAGIVAFLASAESGWVTGRTILADGGLN
jgi:3-oxoacyl-[acyl-carrier protein] reductase